MLRCFAEWVLLGRQKWQVLLFLVIENVELDERHCLVIWVSVGCMWIDMLIEVPSHVWLSFFVKFISWAVLSNKPAILMNDSRKFCLWCFWHLKNSLISSGELQVLVVRQDLKMKSGKIASQCARKIPIFLFESFSIFNLFLVQYLQLVISSLS